jgi:hypothetical protein
LNWAKSFIEETNHDHRKYLAKCSISCATNTPRWDSPPPKQFKPVGIKFTKIEAAA